MGAAATSGRKQYEILRKLAVGGMAEIYLARASGVGGFQKYVVLKKILEGYADDQNFITMFLDEARIAALLQHQNIAQVHDIGESDGSYFFTMEYLHGVDLRQLRHRCVEVEQMTPLPQALTIIAGACSGLHYAHEKRGPDGQPLNIVHRDVSLSNIVVTYDGGVKLVDFGVARASHRDTRTRTGSLKGKVGYMSPEQCRGRPIDRRSDIFSLGVVLYELTTGGRPFGDVDDVNDYATMFQIVEDPPTLPRVYDPSYPPALEAIVLRALAKDPDDRYASARDLLIDIESFAANHRMSLSQSALAAYMEELYGVPDEPWQSMEFQTSEALRLDAKPVKRTISFADPVSHSSADEEATVHRPPVSMTPMSPMAAPHGAPADQPTVFANQGDPSHSMPAYSSGGVGEVSTIRSPRRIGRMLGGLVMVIAGIAGGVLIAWQLSQSSDDEATPASEPTDVAPAQGAATLPDPPDPTPAVAPADAGVTPAAKLPDAAPPAPDAAASRVEKPVNNPPVKDVEGERNPRKPKTEPRKPPKDPGDKDKKKDLIDKARENLDTEW